MNIMHVNQGARDRSRAMWLFLIGLFSLTQLKFGAKIGISELCMVIAAPILYLKDLPILRRDGFMTMLNLLIIWFLGACLSDWINGSIFQQVFRGISVPAVIFSTIVTLHHFLYDDIRDCKWLLFGLACSMILSTFVFQRGTAGDMAAEGDLAGAVERVVGYKLFWSNMITTWCMLPVQTMYLKIPFLLTIILVLICAGAFALTGGRSAFLTALMGLALLLVARKNLNAMRRVKKHIIPIFIVLSLVGMGVKAAYKYAGTHGLLNEYETRKFEGQTAEGDSALRLLMAGRGEFFIACFAIADKPILGHGSWALDTNDYTGTFIRKYGSMKDIEDLRRREIIGENRVGGMFTIPTHSHITTAWLWHGLPGAMFWMYIIYLAVRVLCRCMHVVPELYGYLAVFISQFSFDVFFSPFGLRTGECLFFTLLCFISAAEKRQPRGIM